MAQTEKQKDLRELLARANKLDNSRKTLSSKISASMSPLEQAYFKASENMITRNHELTKFLGDDLSKVTEDFDAKFKDILESSKDANIKELNNYAKRLKNIEASLVTSKNAVKGDEFKYLQKTFTDVEKVVKANLKKKKSIISRAGNLFGNADVGGFIAAMGSGNPLTGIATKLIGDKVSKKLEQSRSAKQMLQEDDLDIQRKITEQYKEVSLKIKETFDEIEKESRASKAAADQKEKDKKEQAIRKKEGKGRGSYFKDLPPEELAEIAKKGGKAKRKGKVAKDVNDKKPTVRFAVDENGQKKIISLHTATVKELEFLNKKFDILIEHDTDKRFNDLELQREVKKQVANSGIQMINDNTLSQMGGKGANKSLLGSLVPDNVFELVGQFALLKTAFKGLTSSIPVAIRGVGSVGAGLLTLGARAAPFLAVGAQAYGAGKGLYNNKERAKEYDSSRTSAGIADVLHGVSFGVTDYLGIGNKDTARSLDNIGAKAKNLGEDVVDSGKATYGAMFGSFGRSFKTALRMTPILGGVVEALDPLGSSVAILYKETKETRKRLESARNNGKDNSKLEKEALEAQKKLANVLMREARRTRIARKELSEATTPEGRAIAERKLDKQIRREKGARSRLGRAGVVPQELISTMNKAGITDPAERAAFLAQTAHESGNFRFMKERGGDQYFDKYDANTGKGQRLGNTEMGDGAKYKGRGYIQLTGKYNYEKYGKMIGVDLVNNPELAEQPEIASKLAVAYWKDRVRPNVKDFNNTEAVTKTVNGGLNGIDDRVAKFDQYLGDESRKEARIKRREKTLGRRLNQDSEKAKQKAQKPIVVPVPIPMGGNSAPTPTPASTPSPSVTRNTDPVFQGLVSNQYKKSSS